MSENPKEPMAEAEIELFDHFCVVPISQAKKRIRGFRKSIRRKVRDHYRGRGPRPVLSRKQRCYLAKLYWEYRRLMPESVQFQIVCYRAIYQPELLYL